MSERRKTHNGRDTSAGRPGARGPLGARRPGVARDEPAVSRRGGRSSARRLAAFRPVEHHPHREVIAEVLEPVRNASGDEQQVARLKRHA